MRARLAQAYCDGDGDLLRGHHRIERDVHVIAQHQLQRVLAGLQRRCVASVWPLPKCWMLSVVGSGRPRSLRQVGIDQQVMMAGVVELHASRRDAHAGKAEHHGDRALHRRAIGGAHDVQLRAGRGSACAAVRRPRPAQASAQRPARMAEAPASSTARGSSRDMESLLVVCLRCQWIRRRPGVRTARNRPR